MDFETYSSFWNHQAATPEGALAGVDGSASEEIVRMTGAWTAGQVSTALALDGSQRVLELGCGVGRIARELLAHCRAWHGVDISRAMVEVAGDRLAGFEAVELSVLERSALPMIGDGAMDAAYSVAVLCHMDKEDLYLYLQELRRVLRPGGLAYLETWNLAHPMGWRRWQFEVDFWARSDQSQRKNVSRNQFCVPEEFRLYLEHAGLEILGLWTASPWIQVVAGHGFEAVEGAAHRQRLASSAGRIAYSEEFSALFGELLDVIYGLTRPAVLADRLERRAPTPEVALFRRYLMALWRQGADQWGPPPK